MSKYLSYENEIFLILIIFTSLDVGYFETSKIEINNNLSMHTLA